ncbi:MAG: helix-turn-helix transcriptional regulator [Chitinophagaceae bacterium]|nr:helix-turn-helix transcriptional regulator [Chitinophagaceae bacterium]
MASPFEITSLKADLIQWSENVELMDKGIYLPSCKGFIAHGGWGNMTFQFYEAVGFSIWYSRYHIRTRNTFKALADTPLLEFSLQLDQPGSFNTKQLGHQTIKNSQFNIFFLPYMESRASFDAGQLTTTLDIHCSFDYLSTLAKYFPDIIIPFLDKVAGKEPTLVFPAPLYATGFMLQLAGNIIHLLRSKTLNLFLLELNVQSLLSYALTCKYELNPKTKRFSLEQIGRIHAIRLQLEKDFTSIPNLASLAKEAHMSKTIFKSLFKLEVGESPYHFWAVKRMEVARARILSSKDSISKISDDLGFPSVSNFSKAFKSRFGISPTDLRESKS